MGSFSYTDVEKNEFSYVHRIISDIENKNKIKLDSVIPWYFAIPHK